MLRCPRLPFAFPTVAGTDGPGLALRRSVGVAGPDGARPWRERRRISGAGRLCPRRRGLRFPVHARWDDHRRVGGVNGGQRRFGLGGRRVVGGDGRPHARERVPGPAVRRTGGDADLPPAHEVPEEAAQPSDPPAATGRIADPSNGLRGTQHQRRVPRRPALGPYGDDVTGSRRGTRGLRERSDEPDAPAGLARPARPVRSGRAAGSVPAARSVRPVHCGRAVRSRRAVLSRRAVRPGRAVRLVWFGCSGRGARFGFARQCGDDHRRYG